VVMKVEPVPAAAELNAEALRIVSAKPDLVFLSAQTQLDLALKALQALSYSGRRLIAFIDDSHIRRAGSAIEGAVTLNTLRLSGAFTKRLKERFPAAEPMWGAHTAYDAMMLYAQAMRRADSLEAQSVIRELRQAEMNGMSGEFRFGGGRLALRPIDGFKVVQNGALVPYQPPRQHSNLSGAGLTPGGRP
jgi:ABC-type branched-subunit amino acid transport system substrate-binding protein